MNLVSFSIKKPVTVIVGIILTVVFGLIGLSQMPYQLSPDVTEPTIAVTTVWTGATPYEIEREVIEEQEKVLKGIPGLIEMESSSLNGIGTVTLKFRIGTNVDNALLRVSNKLNEVPSYPVNVEKPVITATGAETSPVVWMVLKSDGDNPNSVYRYKTFLEDEIRQDLERIEGVADLFLGGGTEKELHVIISPERLASYGLTVRDVIDVLQSENVNISAGIMGVGRKDYRIRTVAEFNSPEDVGGIVLKSTGQRRILVSDVARIDFGYEKLTNSMIHLGKEGIAIGVKPEPGVNILELTDSIEEVYIQLNEGKLREQGIYLDWAYDQRPYIRGAIELVQRNIFIGGVLAIAVLIIFLRSLSSTGIAATAIPISIIGTFFFMNVFGRNLNVVSLAGIAFAVGMLVDNAIVVLENIDRHRSLGRSPFDAAYEGTREVWGAILASTLTTISVFLPVVFMQEEAGQLFRDIALAVTFAVTLSLFVSVSVIPMFANYLFSRRGTKKGSAGGLITSFGGLLVKLIMALVGTVTGSVFSRIITVITLTAVSVLSAWFLLPKMEYLPQGNRNLIINYLVPPPALSYEERKEIGRFFFDSAEPHINNEHEGYPGIKNMFYIGSERFMFFGAISNAEQNSGRLIPLFTEMINQVPGMFGFSQQAGIFQTRLGGGRTVDVDISGTDINRIVQVGGTMFGMIMGEMPEVQIRPRPSLDLLYPEIKFFPDRDRLRAAGLTASEFGTALDVLMDGREIGEFKQEGQKKIDLILKASEKDINTPEELYRSMLTTPGGKTVPVSSLAGLERATGITQIRHLERKRTVTLRVQPPLTIPLQEAMETIEERVIPAVASQGILDGINIRLSGAADKLTETRIALQWNILLALAIAYLLMSALFGNFIYPLIIMFTVPLAGGGGFIGFSIVDFFTMKYSGRPLSFDILTMLGFVILVGVVVNNAILIVHQSLNNVRYHGMGHREAVIESTRTRLRPIYMSASTSIFGMLPLVIAPGPGSELYRGLGSVILGGLALSTVFTVFVIPSLLIFVIKMEKSEK